MYIPLLYNALFRVQKYHFCVRTSLPQSKSTLNNGWGLVYIVCTLETYVSFDNPAVTATMVTTTTKSSSYSSSAAAHGSPCE